MNKIWIACVAGLALFGAGTLAFAATAEAAKAAPAPAASAAQGRARTAKPPATATAKKKLVNLNAASAEELKALPGGSAEEAARIIAGRPYGSKAFLLSNKIIDEGRYGEIRKLVVAGKPAKATAPKK